LIIKINFFAQQSLYWESLTLLKNFKDDQKIFDHTVKNGIKLRFGTAIFDILTFEIFLENHFVKTFLS
jgi:hypothetical protein